MYWHASPLINVKVPTFQSYVKYVRDGSHNGAYVIGPIVLSSCSPTSRCEFFALHDELHNKSFRVPNAISFFDSCDLKITVIIKSVLRLLTFFFLIIECIVPKFLMQETIVPQVTSAYLFYPLTQLDW